MTTSHDNPAFVPDVYPTSKDEPSTSRSVAPTNRPHRETWGKDIEFLLSCIAMSVGLGNVWRFPSAALDNGGGAFLIPYIIVLFLVGRPIYYLEMIMGQFGSRGSIDVYDLCPAMRGIGIAQTIAVYFVSTYYASLNSIIGHYIVSSFKSELPWAKCREEWGPNCVNSDGTSPVVVNETLTHKSISSSELYFNKIVLREKDDIVDGIGVPNWSLVISLFVSWVIVLLAIIKGVRSSGKASYFLAIFPYVILILLLIRSVTLEGAANGILFFIKPQWDKLLSPQVWFAAVTQVFFSLTVCFGVIINYSSHNRFSYNVHRDVVIVSYLDTATSLMSGCTIFGVLGNLAHNLGSKDIASVVSPGTGLAFISYPEAISKFTFLPQLFSVLFFVMLFVLGIGTNVGITSCCVAAIRDHFPRLKQWQAAAIVAVVSFCIGLTYVTPGGQFLLNLVDNYAGSMLVLVVAIFELFLLGWWYGVRRVCKNANLMMDKNPGWYWRCCWGVITPIVMLIILIYTFASYVPLTYKDIPYPAWASTLGWCLFALGVLQLPIWCVVAIIANPGKTFKDKVRGAFSPMEEWGPIDANIRDIYKKEIEHDESRREPGLWNYIKRNLAD